MQVQLPADEFRYTLMCTALHTLGGVGTAFTWTQSDGSLLSVLVIGLAALTLLLALTWIVSVWYMPLGLWLVWPLFTAVGWALSGVLVAVYLFVFTIPMVWFAPIIGLLLFTGISMTIAIFQWQAMIFVKLAPSFYWVWTNVLGWGFGWLLGFGLGYPLYRFIDPAVGYLAGAVVMGGVIGLFQGVGLPQALREG